MADAVDARVLHMQRPLAYAPLYPSFGDPGGQQLCTRDHPVLSTRDPREELLHRAALRSHTDL
jgi:hypothetical protein